MENNKPLTVGDLKEILNWYDDEKCLIIIKDGKDDDFALCKEHIELESFAYFGNCDIGDGFNKEMYYMCISGYI